jgi:hypothetical protein
LHTRSRIYRGPRINWGELAAAVVQLVDARAKFTLLALPAEKPGNAPSSEIVEATAELQVRRLV